MAVIIGINFCEICCALPFVIQHRNLIVDNFLVDGGGLSAAAMFFQRQKNDCSPKNQAGAKHGVRLSQKMLGE